MSNKKEETIIDENGEAVTLVLISIYNSNRFAIIAIPQDPYNVCFTLSANNGTAFVINYGIQALDDAKSYQTSISESVEAGLITWASSILSDIPITDHKGVRINHQGG